MRYGYAYVVVNIALIIVGIFTMYYFATSQSYNSLTPQFGHETQNCANEQMARELAVNSIGSTLSSSGYRFDGILCIWGTGTNDTSELKAVRVAYQSPSAGALIITEDPQLTKVINATVIPNSRYGP
ncbi:MAG TPA: hypothetical protein VFG24_00690 [Nitrosopumilaceae archaeon]|nr:hypothetical protein [Nitrosopumilaceae archaeon]